MMAGRGRLLAAALLLVAAGCHVPRAAGDDAALDALRAEVASLRSTLAQRAAGDTLLAAIAADDGELVVLLRTGLLDELLAWTALRYLADVRLDLAPNIVVRRSETVRVRLGVPRVRAGEWSLEMTILDLRARLHAGRPATRMLDSARLALAVPVTVSDGSGAVHVDFAWDAAAVPSVICRSFRIEERFTGTVGRSTHRLDGHVRLVPRAQRVVAVPDFSQSRLLVQPEPTPDSWSRVRELLDERNSIFQCGLALSPRRMQELLAELMRAGFRFSLPANLFPDVPLPGVLRESVRIDGREIEVTARPRRLRLAPDMLWYSVAVEVQQ